MKKEGSENMNSEELLQHLMKNVSEEKRRSLMEKISSVEPETELPKPIEPDKNDRKHQNFDTLLQQIEEKGGDILSPEEKDFFFKKSINPDIRIEAVEKEPEIFEEVMLAPVFMDIKKLLYLNLTFLGILIFVVCFSVYLQSVNQNLQNNTLVSLRNIESRENADPEKLWDFFALSPEVRKKELEARVNSHLATKNEKRACYFLLATMSFEEQDFASGREYMLKGVQLADEK